MKISKTKKNPQNTSIHLKLENLIRRLIKEESSYDASKEIKKYKYQVSIKNKVDLEKIISKFNLIKDKRFSKEERDYRYGIFYNQYLYVDLNRTVALFIYQDGKYINYDRQMLGFKNRQEYLEFKIGLK